MDGEVEMSGCRDADGWASRAIQTDYPGGGNQKSPRGVEKEGKSTGGDRERERRKHLCVGGLKGRFFNPLGDFLSREVRTAHRGLTGGACV